MRKNLLLALLLVLVAMGESFAQSRVTGKVTMASDDSALPGVTVQVKGSTVGTQTDVNGNYTINATADQTLVFSFIGMETREVAVGNQVVINIQLSEAENLLNEVVVLTALGLERKKDDDMSSSTLIDTKALQRSGESGVIQGLSGKTSGLTVIRNSGDPGAGAYIQIRGQNTIFGDASPLIILDGVPISNSNIGQSVDGVVQQSRLNDINPDDIANVTILKGAAAAAVWGTGAANGVILIQTKKGNAGGKKVSVSITNQTSWDVINREYEKQDIYGQGQPLYWNTGRESDAYRFIFVANSGFSWGDKIANRAGGADEVLEGKQRFVSESGNTYYPILQKNSQETFNQTNRDQVFQTGFTWNKSIGINFNNQGSTTYLNFSDWDQQGIIRGNSNYRRSTVRLNHEAKLSERFKLRVNTTFARINSNRIQQGSNLNGLYLGYLRTSPDFDNRDYKGIYYNSQGATYSSDGATNGILSLHAQRSYRNYLGTSAPIYNNPGWTIYEQDNPNEVYRFILNPELNWNIYKGLNLTARYGFDYYNDARDSFFPVFSAGDNAPGYYSHNEITERNESLNVFLSSTHVFGKNVNLSWIAGSVVESLDYRSFSGDAFKFTNPVVGDLRVLDNATVDNTTTGINRLKQRKSGAYGVVNAELFGQLYLEATGRYELPGTLNAPVFYPSASAGWIFTQLLKSSFVNFGKLRASFGQVGIEPSAYRNKTNFVFNNAGSSWGDELVGSAYGNPLSQSPTAGNPDLKRELVTEFEVGGDLRFMKDLLSLGVTYYNRRTIDALFPLSLPPSSGFSNRWENAATISNKGLEIDAGVRLIETNSFRWRLDANFSQNKNLVESLSGSAFESLNGFTGSSSGVAEGQPFGVIWGRRWLRNDQGRLIFDENGFPTLDETEGPLGDPNPQWRGGLGTQFSWKGISVSAQVETFQGAKMWAGTLGVLNYFGVSKETATEIITDKELRTWDGRTVKAGTTVRGQVHDFGAGDVLLDADWYVRGLGGGFSGAAEQYIRDGSWTKLREITLNYDLPASLIGKIRLTNASVGVTGRNLFIWSPYPYIDPELNLTGASKGRGLDYFTNPGTGSYILTLKLGF